MKTFILLISIFLIFNLNIGYAQKAGDLDNTFNYNGIKILNFGPGYNYVGKVEIQSTGKIILTGSVSDTLTIIRLNNDGSLDNDFGGNGLGYINMNLYSFSMAEMQSDDKIVLVGQSGKEIVLTRLTSNGILDNSFGNNGIQISNILGSYGSVQLIALYPDGKILVLAKIYNNGWNLALVRYKNNGILDESFSNDGISTIQNDKVDYFESLKIDLDGKILVAGSNLVLRFNSEGSLDYSFGKNGIRQLPFDNIHSVEMQGDNKIFCIGDKEFGGERVFAMCRLNKNGSFDEIFIKDGMQICSFGSSAYARDLKLYKDGKIIVGGYIVDSKNEGDFALAQFNNDGTLDKSFGTNGIQTTDCQFSEDRAYSIAIQDDGKIIVAGEADGNFALARYWGTNTTSIINQTETHKDGDLNIYPNPVYDNVFIEGIHQIGRIEILNLQGQIIGTNDVVNETTSIDLSKLGSGVYFFRINTNGTIVTKKVVKL